MDSRITLTGPILYVTHLLGLAGVLTMSLGCERERPFEPTLLPDSFHVRLLEEPGYQILVPKDGAEQLSRWLGDDMNIDLMAKILETTCAVALEGTGTPPALSETGLRMLVSLFKANATSFREALASNMGANGVIVTIRPSKTWLSTQSVDLVGFEWSFDPIQNHHNMFKALRQFLMERYGDKATNDLISSWDREYRRLFWIQETPLTVIIDSTVWTVEPNP